MDAVFFSMKRAHLGGERLGRHLLEPFGLTPARFDLLNTIADCKTLMPQKELWKRLGVVRSAVCEMVKSLMKLALVKRYRAADSRTWIVQLTERGREVAKRAYDALVNRGDATVIVDRLIAGTEIDPAPLRHEWSGTFFDIGGVLGNSVRRNRDLYCWDIEEWYAWLTTAEERDADKVPFIDDVIARGPQPPRLDPVDPTT
jgi:DNA-binding MarR family transcriptional regulator